MAMEIKVSGNAYKTDYADRLQAERENVQKAGNEQNADKAADQKPHRMTSTSAAKSRGRSQTVCIM